MKVYVGDESMKETELKVLLTKRQYSRLCQRFSCDTFATQINFYYTDETEVLKNKNITIRVRAKNGNLALQVKVPCGQQGLVHTKNEYEKSLDEVPYIIKGEILQEMTGIAMSDVCMKGYLITERRKTKFENGTEICLDYNQYLGMDDYELEVEYNEEIPSFVFSILKDEKINLMENKGKCSRFFEQLERRKYGKTK